VPRNVWNGEGGRFRPGRRKLNQILKKLTLATQTPRLWALNAGSVPGYLIKDWGTLESTHDIPAHLQDDFREQVACDMGPFAQERVSKPFSATTLPAQVAGVTFDGARGKMRANSFAKSC
jgi:hypothetical protein